MFPKLFKSSDTASASAPVQKKAPPPIITEEADRAIFRVQLRYAMIAFALAIFGVVSFAIIGAKYPHSPLLRHAMESRPILLVVASIWLIPFLIGQIKQSALRLQYARQYAEQQRWGVVIAALRSFTEWGQKSFDRDGEAHYLLAQAYDRTNRKELARKMREFIRKHRSGSEWARRIGAGPNGGASPTITRIKRAPPTSGDLPEATPITKRPDRTGQVLTKPSRRKRF